MKILFAIFACFGILAVAVSAIAAMDIAPKQKLVKKVFEHNAL
jgi:hypothetical protein